ncbi:MAG: NAD(+)/NADH kinase [Actinomycetota bacterium]|nr:NAD(+)/NADH kinase [Actinomycetota bacterium]
MAKKINNIAIIPNLDKPEVPAIALDLIKWLSKHGIKSRITEADAIKMDVPELASDDAEIQECDLVVCLGGDGTILRAVRLLAGAPVPVIGVNLGRVGFLTEVEAADLYPAMERVIAGDFDIDERMMLKCTVKAGEFSYDYLALNEVAVERGHHQRMLEMNVYINGISFSQYTADGLIFATPTGSTAYSFSTGGPIVSPANNLILLTPINPHSLFGRTIVLAEHDYIDVDLAKPFEVLIGIDGFAVLGTVIDSISVKKSDAKALLVKLKEKSFYTLFKEKLRVWDTWLR